MRLLPASTHRAMPWKNGGGTTTEIARFPEDASLDDFEWRVSLARVEAAGPFSRFTGVDRTIALVTGGGMTLEIEGRGRVALERGGAPFAFPGEVSVSSTLPDGAVEDFNAMSRRGAWRHWVTRVRVAERARWAALGDRAVLFAARGAFDSLEARGALVLEASEAIELAPVGDAEMVVVDLWRR